MCVTDRQPADEDLMLAYQRGDRDVFDELYARYAKPIYNFFRRTALDDGTADDLVQKTFLKLHVARGHYRAEGSFRSWIFAVARNVLRDDARQRGRARIKKTDEFNEQISTDPVTQVRPNAEIEVMVTEALATLPLTQREVIVLNRYHGMTYAEIGELLGINANAVKQRAFQAMRTLRQRLSIDSERSGEE
ncbi:MAG: sigma-70 family RNA polymerase sigma factor [Luteitalea sp.]|nr:sigma-70 family RNA polymerase sigma factor [Luteitalea sp.]